MECQLIVHINCNSICYY